MVTLRTLMNRLNQCVFAPVRRRRRSRQNNVVTVDVLEQRIVPATVVWTGGSLLNDKWSNPKNWEGEVTPHNGDQVEFGPEAGRFDRAPINDITGLKLTRITITTGGYTLKGNGIELSGGVSTTFSEEAALNGDQPTANVIEQDITIPAEHKLLIGLGERSLLHIAGRISGPTSADVEINSSDSQTLETRPKVFFTGNKNNSFGKTVVRAVDVGLSRTAGVISIPGDLTIGTKFDSFAGAVFMNKSDQIRDTANIQLVGTSRIQFGVNVSETVNSLTFAEPVFDGARIQGGGNLTVKSHVTVTPTDQLNTLFKTITIDVKSLNRTGPGELTFDVPAHRGIEVLASVKGNTGIRKTGAGSLIFGGAEANTYSGITSVAAGIMVFNKPSRITALPGTLEIGSATASQTAPNQSPAVKVSLSGDEIVSNTAVIKVHPNGLLEATGLSGPQQDEVFGELILNGGRVTTFHKLSPKRVTVQPSALGSQVIGELHVPASTFGVNTTVEYHVADGIAVNDLDGVRSTGNGSWIKRGLGTMRSSFGENTAFQSVTVAEGTLELKDLRQGTIVTVGGGGTLKGEAIIGGLSAKSDGRVDSSQLLTVFGNVEFKPFSIQQLRPLSTTTNQMSLVTTGDVILGDVGAQAFPVLDILPQGTIPLGTKVTVMRVAPNKTLTGRYATPTPTNIGGTVLNEGTTFTAGGQNFTISYTGGTSGKDVVVTRNTGPAFVNRALPTVANEGEQVTLRGKITEPDSGDSFRLTVNWGDGQTETFDFPAGSDPNVALNHKYEQDGQYSVHLDWRDQHGGGNTGDHRIRIRNQHPVLQDLAVTSPVSRNSAASLFGRVSDAGSKDLLKVTVRWGDGSGAETLTVSPTGELQATHNYRRAGRYRVVVEVFDGSDVTTTRLWLKVL